MKAVREVTTAELQVGDTVDWDGERREVRECRDTGRPAAFGSGTAYDVTLLRQDGTTMPMQAAAFQRWLRV